VPGLAQLSSLDLSAGQVARLTIGVVRDSHSENGLARTVQERPVPPSRAARETGMGIGSLVIGCACRVEALVPGPPRPQEKQQAFPRIAA
jgi:hypothetical protein